MLEEADGAPTRTHGTSEKYTHLQNSAAKLVKGGEGLVVEGLIPGYRDDCEHDREKAGETREGTDPVGYVGAKTRRVSRMEECA